MSKIGRKAIDIGNVQVEINGQELSYRGQLASGVHILPDAFTVTIEEKKLIIAPIKKDSDTNRVWGLQRALIANKIIGADKGFEKQVKIVGLGFKAIKKAEGLEFSLGFSHKINFSLPLGVSIEIDKTGQLLLAKSSDKQLLGAVCSQICSLRPVEPYKGTGIHCAGDVIRRKAGKAKS